MKGTARCRAGRARPLSFLAYGDFNTQVTGLDAFKPENHPPVQAVFQFFHLMVGIGMTLIGLSLIGAFLWWRGVLFDGESRFARLYLWALVLSVVLPQMANELGWFTAEVGRQPWIVYGLLRTSDGLSEAVSAPHLWFSLILFGLIYMLLFALFIFLLDRKIRQGPVPVAAADTTVKRHMPFQTEEG